MNVVLVVELVMREIMEESCGEGKQGVNTMIIRVALICAAMVAIAGCRYAPKDSARIATPGTPYQAEPANAELLYEKGGISLYSGETDADVAFNAEAEFETRNSLFLKRRNADGSAEWRLLLTTDGDWKNAEGMDDWGNMQTSDLRRCYKVVKASVSKDGRYIWMVCDPSCSAWWDVVCRFDLRENSFCALMDGCDAIEQPDGTIMVTGKKTYLSDENGEPLGARWYDLWMTPDGEVVRKGRLWSIEEMAAEASNENAK